MNTTSNYNDLYKQILQISGNEISRLEQIALLVHTSFMKNNFIYKDKSVLTSDWNNDFGKAEFEYTYQDAKIKVNLDLTSTGDQDKIPINISASMNGKDLNINSAINIQDNSFAKIDFENLDGTIKDFENFVKNSFIKEISNFIASHRRSNLIYNPSDLNYFQPPYSNPYVQPSINPGVNPFFSTGGGSIPGGNLVGPNSDIFTSGNPYTGTGTSSNRVRYDPIGPFGTFGGPEPDPNLQKKSDQTDPFSMGGDPFKGEFPFGGGFPFKKGPSGGQPPFI